MDLIQLRYFLGVAEHGGFTKAAAALHIAQPAITRQIRLLEEDLGVQLLLRHSRGAELTDAGRRLVAGAELIFRDMADVRAQVVASSEAVSGCLRIGFPPSVGDLLISKAVRTFRLRYPQVGFSLREGYSHALRDDLLGDRLDVAVITGREDNPLLIPTSLFAEQLWLLELPGPRRRRKPGYALADLAGRSLVQPSRANTMRLLLEDLARQAGIELSVVVEADGIHTIKGLVAMGVGAHVSPYSAISRGIESGEFAGGPIAGLMIERQLVRRADRSVSAALLRFQEVLLEELASAEASSQGAIRVHKEAASLLPG
ncbi:LysR family transcriptional regulator [Hydrogenophaga laconesensis]|uniref:LysR family nitrogen assimilation transcriptional regulator n=1 Tax=Hydrogenophaga laconesensis TaxID=1805971 RepID=A0ABU1VAX2_9BURK|nr:LysR family transcriptional regulator [Hydrogenophaga laconesensis]MDR7094614.1 LysR family nitrogen assimilation transcriptional regulator [Hydrogenophaga laconesensis]